MHLTFLDFLGVHVLIQFWLVYHVYDIYLCHLLTCFYFSYSSMMASSFASLTSWSSDNLLPPSRPSSFRVYAPSGASMSDHVYTHPFHYPHPKGLPPSKPTAQFHLRPADSSSLCETPPSKQARPSLYLYGELSTILGGSTPSLVSLSSSGTRGGSVSSSISPDLTDSPQALVQSPQHHAWPLSALHTTLSALALHSETSSLHASTDSSVETRLA